MYLHWAPGGGDGGDGGGSRAWDPLRRAFCGESLPHLSRQPSGGGQIHLIWAHECQAPVNCYSDNRVGSDSNYPGLDQLIIYRSQLILIGMSGFYRHMLMIVWLGLSFPLL